MVAGYCHGFLGYLALCNQQNTTMTYDKRFMEVLKEKFQIWTSYSMRRLWKAITSNTMCALCQPHCVLFVKLVMVGIFLQAAAKSKREWTTCPKIMWSYQSCSPHTPADFQFHRILVIWALQHIGVGKGLYYHYRITCSFKYLTN